MNEEFEKMDGEVVEEKGEIQKEPDGEKAWFRTFLRHARVITVIMLGISIIGVFYQIFTGAYILFLRLICCGFLGFSNFLDWIDPKEKRKLSLVLAFAWWGMAIFEIVWSWYL